MFFKGSRYENVETDRFTNADGQVVRFKKVRFIPDTLRAIGNRREAG